MMCHTSAYSLFLEIFRFGICAPCRMHHPTALFSIMQTSDRSEHHLPPSCHMFLYVSIQHFGELAWSTSWQGSAMQSPDGGKTWSVSLAAFPLLRLLLLLL